MKNDKIDKKNIAKSLYTEGSYTQEEIADKVNVTRQTVSRWIKEGSWDELKASLTVTSAEIIAQLQHQIVEINKSIAQKEEGKRFATPAEADALAKLAGSIKKLESDVGISDCIAVSMRILTWLRKFDKDKAIEYNNIFDAFIKDVIGGKS